jgi:hypothetical protein
MTVSDSSPLSLDVFLRCLHDQFIVSLPGGDTYPITLVEASGLRAHPHLMRQPFQLKFTGPGPRYLMQATYTVNHARLGEVEWFLVPIGQEDGGFVYQAVFT